MPIDPRLKQLIEKWDELCDGGKTPTPEDLCRDCPELLESFLQLLTQMDQIDKLRPGEAPQTLDKPLHEMPPNVQGYELVEEIGRGAFGVVYRARDLSLDRDVAVKLPQDSYRANSETTRRFFEEARITGQSQHPGIPPVHQLGKLPDGRPFLAMKLVKGRTFAKLLSERPDPAVERGRDISIFEQVCQAVAYAHAHRVIHRDLKPKNIMVVGRFGEVQVIDWGLAKVLPVPGSTLTTTSSSSSTEVADGLTRIQARHPGEEKTVMGSAMGTYAYMSPEQAGGEIDKVDARSDVFGLGGILCVILTGQPPYRGQSDDDIRVLARRGKLDDAYARLATCGAEPGLVDLCRRCLAFEQSDRPADASVVAQELVTLRRAAEDRAKQAELSRARAEVKIAEERKRRRVQAIAAAAAFMVILLGGSSLGWWLWQRKLTGDYIEPRLAEAEEVLRHPEKDPEQAQHLLNEAKARMAGGGPAELEMRLAARQHDLDLVRRLESARLRMTTFLLGKLDYRGANLLFAEAFADFGLDVSGKSEEDGSDKIRASSISTRLVIALDQWAHCKEVQKESGIYLRALADRADDDLWRKELRQAMQQYSETILDHVTNDEHALDHPPSDQLLLVFALARVKGELAAENWLRKAVERYPDDVSTNLYLATILILRKPSEAIPFLQAALALRPRDPRALLMRGFAWEQKEDYERAIKDYGEASRLDRKSPLGFLARGFVWYQKKEYDKAIRDYDEAIRLDPKSALAFGERGNAWLAKEDYNKAIQDYNTCISLDPQNELAFATRGLAWLCKKEYDKAIQDYNKAIDFDSITADNFYNRGNAWSAKKEYHKAIRDYNKVISFGVQNADVFYSRGNAWSGEKEYDKAIQDYDQAIVLAPGKAEAYHNRGKAWSEKKEYDKAIRDYDEAIRLVYDESFFLLDPAKADFFQNRANAWRYKKQYDKAIGDYDEAIRLDPKNADREFHRSVTQMLMRRPETAGGFQKVLNLQGWKGDLSAYAVILGHFAARETRDENVATRFLKDSVGKLDETWPHPAVRFLRGEIDEPALLALATDDDKRTEVRCYLGLDHAIKGDKKEALAHFHWVKEHGNPSFTAYTIALAELDRVEPPPIGTKR